MKSQFKPLVPNAIVRHRMKESANDQAAELRGELRSYYEAFNHAERTLINDLIGTYRKLATALESR